MRGAAAVGKIADEIAARIDPVRICRTGARDIDGNRVSPAQEKSMRYAITIKGIADDSALRVDIKREREGSSRDIDAGEAAVAK